MNESYFQRVRALTATQFFINNPTRDQMRLALRQGATGCTNNPSFAWKILSNPEEEAYFLPLLDRAIGHNEDDHQAQCAFQRALVKDVSELMMPLYRESHGQYGYVSIQGDPLREHDAQAILKQGRLDRQINPNICIKVPATKAGLEAMRVLLAEDTPVNATEVMSVSQGLAVCRLYNQVSQETGKHPPIYLSFIAGILNEYLRGQTLRGELAVDKDTLWQAGAAACRKMHRLVQAGRYPVTMISGGVRESADFTDYVGGNIAITLNWQGRGSAAELLEANPNVVSMIDLPTPDAVIDELRGKVPEFTSAYDVGALAVEAFADFGPVKLFRSNFLSSWHSALDYIAARRRALAHR